MNVRCLLSSAAVLALALLACGPAYGNKWDLIEPRAVPQAWRARVSVRPGVGRSGKQQDRHYTKSSTTTTEERCRQIAQHLHMSPVS